MDKGIYIGKTGKIFFPFSASTLQYRTWKIKICDPFCLLLFIFLSYFLLSVPLFHTINCSTLLDINICTVKLLLKLVT